MITLRKRVLALYVDRSSQQWIVRDPDGNFWLVPSADHAWDHRQPSRASARRRWAWIGRGAATLTIGSRHSRQ